MSAEGDLRCLIALMMGIMIVIPDARISMDPLKAYTYSYLPLASNMKPIINKYNEPIQNMAKI